MGSLASPATLRASRPRPSDTNGQSSGVRRVVTLIHLAAWAELGVLTRAFLDKLFSLGCGGAWGPCLAGGFYFNGLPANLAGSFVIGLFAASSVLGLNSGRPLALLPAAHPWQANISVQIGVRTGYCGCLTTFSSWNLALMTEAINSNKWANAVFGFVVGLYCALGSCAVGMHGALAIDRWMLQSDVRAEREARRLEEFDYERGLSAAPVLSAEETEALEMEPDLPRGPLQPVAGPQTSFGTGLRQRHESWGTLRRRLSSLLGGAGGKQATQEESGAPAVLPAGPGAEEAHDGLPADEAPQQGALSVGGEPAEFSRAPPEVGLPADEAPQQGALSVEGKPAEFSRAPPEVGLPAGLARAVLGSWTNACALACLVLLTAWLATGTALEGSHNWLRTIWLSALMGPFGCLLRYRLSRLNYRSSGRWAWFPTGTYCANMLGTAITFAMQCIQVKVTLTPWGSVAVAAVQSGFCGALTTVSTLATEVLKMHELFPDALHSYAYLAATFGSSITMALALYGWTQWA